MEAGVEFKKMKGQSERGVNQNKNIYKRHIEAYFLETQLKYLEETIEYLRYERKTSRGYYV